MQLQQVKEVLPGAPQRHADRIHTLPAPQAVRQHLRVGGLEPHPGHDVGDVRGAGDDGPLVDALQDAMQYTGRDPSNWSLKNRKLNKQNQIKNQKMKQKILLTPPQTF